MREMPTSGGIVGRALSWLVPFLVVSAAYLYTFPQPNILYAAVVLLHALGGVLVAILLIPAFVRLMRRANSAGSPTLRSPPASATPNCTPRVTWPPCTSRHGM